ncbi:rhamnogalacturonan lyase [Nesterenkonia sp. F]|uniref:rhamnogalacturonan lyase n=1 Tax=Nesterenkonia sp. F TaxID=795955 RepID=UPI000255D1CA|nr:rhamnogalacturonan lyase [Nesterenkonia sp. F]
MQHRRPARTTLLAGVCAASLAVAGLGGGAAAAAPPGDPAQTAGAGGDVQLEELDRGLVAVAVEDGVHLSWRLLGAESSGSTGRGVKGPAFHVMRDGKKIATVTDSTDYRDAAGDAESTYTVRPVRGGGPVGETGVWAEGHHDVPLSKPAGGTTPAGEEYGYTANDVSVGDVTGDGSYEYVVKWDPTNSKDVSQVGYTGPVFVDTYTADGEVLNRIDLGPNIRAGAHYTQFLVQDFDDDGTSEIMLKTAPGSSSAAAEDGELGESSPITLPADDVAAGVGHDDDHRLSAEGYYDHLVEMFQGWDEHPEVVAGNWPATLEEAFGIEPRHDYPLSRSAAEDLADYFVDEYAPSRSGRNDLRSFEGFILDGPEYLTVFDGATGEELDTVDYEPTRGDDGLMWGDYAMSRIEPGNRVDRFLSGVAYLDGQHPSAIFARGYYTRAAVATYDFDGEEISTRWLADSGHVAMDNPFDASPHGKPGRNESHAELAGQGFHTLSAADVDDDGRHEIVYGGATLDDDGSLLYSSTAEGHPASAIAGETAPLGHGDAQHVGDFDPSRDGLEIFTVHEGSEWAPYGYVMRAAEDGEVLWGGYTGVDTGRGMVGDIDPDRPGFEAWTSGSDSPDPTGLFSVDGEHLGDEAPSTNMSIRWSPDMTTQLITGADTGDRQETPEIVDWTDGTVLSAEGTLTNNHTKGNPGLVADVLGDWREEMIVRTEDSSALRIHTSTEDSDRRLYTLMHDPQYRAGVARQQTSYNQPAYTSFHLGADIDWKQVPPASE